MNVTLALCRGRGGRSRVLRPIYLTLKIIICYFVFPLSCWCYEIHFSNRACKQSMSESCKPRVLASICSCPGCYMGAHDLSCPLSSNEGRIFKYTRTLLRPSCSQECRLERKRQQVMHAHCACALQLESLILVLISLNPL